jgi:hypothetical protein
MYTLNRFAVKVTVAFSEQLVVRVDHPAFIFRISHEEILPGPVVQSRGMFFPGHLFII